MELILKQLQKHEQKKQLQICEVGKRFYIREDQKNQKNKGQKKQSKTLKEDVK